MHSLQSSLCGSQSGGHLGFCSIALSAAILLCAIEGAVADDLISTIAVTGMAEPSSGGTFQTVFGDAHFLNAPPINGPSQVAFSATLTGPDFNTDNDLGVWISEPDRNLTLIAREGTLLPDANFGFRHVGMINLNESGEIAFGAALDGPGIDSSNNSSVLSNAGGAGLQVVAREGDLAPGSSLAFEEIPEIHLTDNGAVIVLGRTVHGSPSADGGIWRKNVGEALQLVSLEGTPIPGHSDVPEVVGYETSNASGDLLFGTRNADGTGVSWKESSGVFHPVMRAGDPVPGSTNEFAVAVGVDLNDMGKLALVARVFNSQGTTQRYSIWSDRDGALAELSYHTSDSAPETDAHFYDFDEISLNNADRLAIVGRLEGEGIDPYGQGLWLEDDAGELSLVAYAGEVAPGTDFFFGRSFKSPVAFNDAGQVAFAATVYQPGSPRPPSATGIWATDRRGNLHLIALTTGTGDDHYLDVSDDPNNPDLRLISELEFGPQGLSDTGQLAFHATFTDGSSGIFVADLAVFGVPEPSTLAVATPAVGTILVSRIRKRNARRRCR